MKLLLFGSRYLPYRHEGDKNFWLSLVETLKREVEHICIISVNRDQSGDYFQAPNVHIRNVSPFPFPTIRSRFSDPNLRLSNNYVSKSLSFLKIHGQISRIVREKNVQVVHFMDNYGPLMVRLKRRLNVPLSIFAPTYHPRYPLYDYFLRLSFVPFEKIITTTYAFKGRLVNLGIPEDKIEVIRWGVNTDELKPNCRMREQTREKLGIDPDSRIIFWSGFLQQIGVRDLQYSLKIAKETLKQKNDYTFIFALKYVHFKEEYVSYEKEGIKILAVKSNMEFLNLVNAADAFLSPILTENSIVAPPLTWIECMAYCVPIVTTNVRGVDELISDGHTGYTFSTIKEASQKIQTMLTDETSYRKISVNARRIVCREYDIKGIANKFIDLWKQMSEWRR